MFPIQIEKILMQFKELGSNYLITLETIGNSDEMLIEVELSDLFTDDYSALQRLTKGITRQLKDELLLTPRIKLVAKGSLPTTKLFLLFFHMQRMPHALLFGQQIATIVLVGCNFDRHVFDNFQSVCL